MRRERTAAPGPIDAAASRMPSMHASTKSSTASVRRSGAPVTTSDTSHTGPVARPAVA